MGLPKKVDEKSVPWPIIDWNSVKAKNNGGSFSNVRWGETDWSKVEGELSTWGLTQNTEPVLGLAVELITARGIEVVSAIRLLWRHENALYHGVLLLKQSDTWQFCGATVHDVTQMDWLGLSAKALGWVEEVPLPLLGNSRTAWKEGKAWFLSQQESCWLKERQGVHEGGPVFEKPAL